MRVESRPGTFMDRAKKIGPAVLLAGALSQIAIKPAEAVAIPDEVDAVVCYQSDLTIVKYPDESTSTTFGNTRSFTTSEGDRALHHLYSTLYDDGDTLNGETSYILSKTFTGSGLYFSTLERQNNYISAARGIVVPNLPTEQETEIFQDGRGECRAERVKSEVFMVPGMYYEVTLPGGNALGTLENIKSALEGQQP